MKRTLLAASLLFPLAALAQDYPSPTLRSATVLGGTTTGTLSMSGGTATGFGTAIGNVPIFINYNGGGNPGLKFNGQFIMSRQSPAATNAADFHLKRDTTFTGGSLSNINKLLYLDPSYGAGDATFETPLLITGTTNGNSGGKMIGLWVQAIRTATARDHIWATNMAASDNTGLVSSAVGSPTLVAEFDMFGSLADDAANGLKFGNVGFRHFMHFVADRVSGASPFEITTGLWFDTNGDGTSPAAPTQAQIDQVIGFAQGTQIIQALDTRGAAVPASYTDPLAAVRMSAGQIIDFSGGAALTSAAGRYLTYNSGSAKLQYMNTSATELFSVPDTGGISVGNSTATTTPLVTLNAASGTRQIRWQTAGSLRGSIGLNTTAETATVAIATNATLDPTSPALSLTTNAATASGNILSFASTAGVVAGMTVVGTNITAGTKVTVVTATQAVLNANVTGGGVANGATVKFGGNVLSFASTAGVTVGMQAQGGLNANTRVTAVTGTTVTLSSNPSGTIASGTTMTFSAMTGGDLTFSRFTDAGGTIDSPLSIARARRGITTNGALNASTTLVAMGAVGADNATALYSVANVSGNLTTTGQYYLNRMTTTDTVVGGAGSRGLFGIEYTAGPGSTNVSWAADVVSNTSGTTGDFTAGGSFQAGALRATGKAANNQGGTNTDAASSGSVWGGNIVGALNSGATNFIALRGLEINVGIATGASAAVKQGLKITLQGATDAVAAAHENSFIQISAGQTTSKMESGLQLAGSDGYWPFNSSSTLINANKFAIDGVSGGQAIGSGVDLWALDVNADAFRAYGSTGPFRVTGGTAETQIGTALFTPSSSGITIDAKGAYGTAAAVSTGGTGWAVNDLARDSNGGVYKIATLSGSAAATVTVLRAPYLTSTSTPANPVSVTAEYPAVGTGLTVNLTWNTTANGIVLAAAGTKLGFYGTAAISKQTGVAVTAAGIHAALTALGLIAP